MEPQKYLQAILNNQTLSEESSEIEALQYERKKVEKILRNSFKDSSIDIQYAGSYKKGTTIRDSYDLDIICYFNHDDESAGKTLEDIYNNVKKALESEYRVEPKKSALRLESNDRVFFHIDVVPGRFIDDKKDDVFLYQSQGDKGWLKTNLQKHIDYIKESGLIDIIKLVKFWKTRNGLEVKTFALELLVVGIVGKSNGKKLDDGLRKFWIELRDNIDNIKIEDPANPTGNDLSELFNAVVKANLSSVASRALEIINQQGWEIVFGEAESVSTEEKLATIRSVRKENPNYKPWGNAI